MDRTSFTNTYWRYYLTLEDRFVHTFRFVEPSQKNFGSFSIEFEQELLTIGSEIDIFLRFMCSIPDSDRSTMDDYSSRLLNDKTYSLLSRQVNFCYGNIPFFPFKLWSMQNPGESLTWWKAYNGVKHNRIANYLDANFENVVASLAALFLLETLYWKMFADSNKIEPDILLPESSIFKVESLSFSSSSFSNSYSLYDLDSETLKINKD